MNKCDVCGHVGDDVVAGRWVFYCSKSECRQVDFDKTYDNEIKHTDMDGNDDTDMTEALADGELCEMILENM